MSQWQKGQSGNPNGRPKRGFTFTDALKRKGSPDELAELAWKGARSGEQWAVTLIAKYIEPPVNEMGVTIHRSLRDMSDEELDALLDQAKQDGWLPSEPEIPVEG